ncbi:MAG: D-alanyl-D-alanine carboxypeptidase [bacterium]|nr:D-alanyl-D-alanine carboxypeptidase [bacterium]
MRSKLIILTILTLSLVAIAGFFVWKGLSLSVAEGDNLPADETRVADNTLEAAIVAAASEPNYFPIRDFNISEPEITAKAGVIYDRSSGRFLYKKNADEHLPIASITKLMTAIVAIEKLDMNRIVIVSVENINVDGNGADLYQNEKIYISDLIKMLLIKSSNDAALTLAERAKERGMDFVLEMNKKALELGMVNTRFNDPAGLSDDAFSTASDLVKLVNHARDYDQIWEIMRIQTADITSIDANIVHRIVNTNKLLGEIPGIIGGKTGFTDGAGGTMLLVAEHENSELISIVLGTENRFGEIKQLIEWAKMTHRWK